MKFSPTRSCGVSKWAFLMSLVTLKMFADVLSVVLGYFKDILCHKWVYFTKIVTLSVMSSWVSFRGFSRVLITKTRSLVVYVIVSGYFSEVMVKNGLICTEILNI